MANDIKIFSITGDGLLSLYLVSEKGSLFNGAEHEN